MTPTTLTELDAKVEALRQRLYECGVSPDDDAVNTAIDSTAALLREELAARDQEIGELRLALDWAVSFLSEVEIPQGVDPALWAECFAATRKLLSPEGAERVSRIAEIDRYLAPAPVGEDKRPVVGDLIHALRAWRDEEISEGRMREIIGLWVNLQSFTLPPVEDMKAVTNDDQIKHMVSRFLGWRLPKDFSPDAGISFKPDFNVGTEWPMKHEPTGTNLFDVNQAEAMVRYMLDGMELSAAPGAARDAVLEIAEFCEERAKGQNERANNCDAIGAYSSAREARQYREIYKEVERLAKSLNPARGGEHG